MPSKESAATKSRHIGSAPIGGAQRSNATGSTAIERIYSRCTVLPPASEWTPQANYHAIHDQHRHAQGSTIPPRHHRNRCVYRPAPDRPKAVKISFPTDRPRPRKPAVHCTKFNSLPQRDRSKPIPRQRGSSVTEQFAHHDASSRNQKRQLRIVVEPLTLAVNAADAPTTEILVPSLRVRAMEPTPIV